MQKKLLLIRVIESHLRYKLSNTEIIRLLCCDTKGLKKAARFVIKAEQITGQKYRNRGRTLNKVQTKRRVSA
jgi:hypothetical protein